MVKILNHQNGELFEGRDEMNKGRKKILSFSEGIKEAEEESAWRMKGI